MRKRTLIPIFYILFLMLPIYWLVAMSFKTTQEILGGFSLFPQTFTLENYAVIFTDPTWYWGYINSIIYVSLNTRARSATAAPKWVKRTCLADRSKSGAPSVSSNSLICIESAGCEIAQTSAARPKWPCSIKASKYLSCLTVTSFIRQTYRNNQKIQLLLIEGL